MRQRGCQSDRPAPRAARPRGGAPPELGPWRMAAELAGEKWAGMRISDHGVWRALCRIMRAKRLGLIAL